MKHFHHCFITLAAVGDPVARFVERDNVLVTSTVGCASVAATALVATAGNGLATGRRRYCWQVVAPVHAG